MAGLDQSGSLLVLFFVMHMLGWIGSTIILLTVLLSKVKRNIIWMNLCFSWIFACFFFSLLLLTGQLNTKRPNHVVCLIQAGAVYAGPSLTAGTTLALALDLWLKFRHVERAPGDELKHLLVTNLSLSIPPFIVPVCLYIGVFAYGAEYPDRVGMASNGLYCGIDNPIPGLVSAVYVAATLIPTLALEGVIIYRFYQSNLHSLHFKNGMTTVIRLVMFTFCGAFGVAISLVYFSSVNYGRLPNVLMALPPVSFVLVFGSQLDLLHVWTCYRLRAASRSSRAESQTAILSSMAPSMDDSTTSTVVSVVVDVEKSKKQEVV